jgi:hypothetical protein
MAEFPISGKPMPDFKFEEISIGEITDLNDDNLPAKEGQKLLAKMGGMSVAEVRALNPRDWKALVNHFWVSYGRYMKDDEKNSLSAST